MMVFFLYFPFTKHRLICTACSVYSNVQYFATPRVKLYFNTDIS